MITKRVPLRVPGKLTAVLVVALLIVAAVVIGVSTSSGYRLRLVLPQASGIFNGVPVRIANVNVGSVTDVYPQSGKAVVEVRIDADRAPLHQGTRPVITSRSLIGEDYLQLQPGPVSARPLANGSTVRTDWSQVHIEDLLETLDPPTRAHLRSLLEQTKTTLGGHEQDLNSTVRTAGPAVQALGQVLAAVGSDGPAIHQLVTRLNGMVGAVASRHRDVSSAVSNLATVTQDVAAHQQQLRSGLAQLPTTLRAADGTLDKVPHAVDTTRPLLASLRPAAARLPSVAANLSPLLQQLRPTVAELTPTIRSANVLLRKTPSLLDSAHAVVPGVTTALNGLAPALNFLRPYTPDLVGWLSNWAGVFGGYSSQGHYGHLLLTLSATAVNNNPGIKPPGLNFDRTTAPGTAAGQPWTDASGEPIR
ncbi:MlaD family protein [Sciscionella marina]|uniref:MlaD family protein n=1 Tax=Sciscionella marina TaxID=508770 RepID=UPI00036ABE36|nr:MlaD family protein [Sciscionella marina]